MRDIQALISKCVEGRAAADVIKEIEEELPDVKSIKLNLLKEFKRAGLAIKLEHIEADQQFIRVTAENQEDHSEITRILESYVQVYSEFEFVLDSSIATS